jgi:hypothetical protein
MLYVSFVEIMKKSQEYLSCATEHSALASVGCFFSGVIGSSSPAIVKEAIWVISSHLT